MAAAAYAVVFAAEAATEVLKIAAWWHEHRPAAPTLFEDELRRALAKAASYPAIGAVVRPRRGPSARALVLQRSGYVVIYDVDEEASVIQVLRVRHGRRRPLARLKRR